MDKGRTMIDLYTWTTPNGRKVSIMLEECGLAYTVYPVDIRKDEQFQPAFLKISPNNKIPAIIDPNGPGGRPLPLFESGAILIYLAEKTGMLMPEDPAGRYECIQWVMFQMGGIGPMFGQLGHFHKFAADKVRDNPYPVERYAAESRRLLGVLERRLAGRPFIMGDELSIADIASFPWVRNLRDFYEAGDLVGLGDFTRVGDWLERCLARPAVQRGLVQPSRA